jgi:AcrR family transcriptional regulator
MSRDNQRQRTRKDLLRAAGRLMADGRTPSLEEIAEAAMVSRATAYRHFPGLDALLLEASLDLALPETGELFGEGAPADLTARLERVDDTLDAMIRGHEAPLRMLLIHALQQKLKGEKQPVRQNRRTPLIEAAIAPAGLTPANADLLAKAMALVSGTEAHLVFEDVLGVDAAEARRVRRWAIAALVAAARGQAKVL